MCHIFRQTDKAMSIQLNSKEWNQIEMTAAWAGIGKMAVGQRSPFWRSPVSAKKSGRSTLVNACVRTLHTLSRPRVAFRGTVSVCLPRRASIAAEHARSGAPGGRQC